MLRVPNIVVAGLIAAALLVDPGAAHQLPPREPVVVKVESNGFHWRDAAFGAAAALGAVLVVASWLFVRNGDFVSGRRRR